MFDIHYILIDQIGFPFRIQPGDIEDRHGRDVLPAKIFKRTLVRSCAVGTNFDVRFRGLQNKLIEGLNVPFHLGVFSLYQACYIF